MRRVALQSMDTIHQNLNTPTSQRTVIVGAPLIAKIAAGIAVVVAAGGAVAWPDPIAVTVSVIDLIAAWRLFRLAVLIEGDELVVRNLFADVRFNRRNAVVSTASTDLRTRTPWGGQFLPQGSITKMNDDNMQTHAKVLRVTDRHDRSHTTHIDCSLGILPKAQAELRSTLQAAI